MRLFFELEGAYLIIAALIILATVFVSTRPFITKGVWKKSVPIVSFVLAIFIGGHFYTTLERMNEVEERFLDKKPIICESRAIRKVAQGVVILPNQEWELKDHIFSSPNFERDFFSARCISYEE